MTFTPAGTVFASIHLRLSPCAEQRNSTSMAPEVVCVAETHFGVALQSPVYVGEAVARVARAVDEDDPGLRVGEQQADQFAGGIPGASDDADPDHFLLRFWTLW